MSKLRLKVITIGITFGLFWALGILPSGSQPFNFSSILDPEVLIASARPSANNSGLNLETSLVDIKAVDTPSLHTIKGETALGSNERYGQGVIIDSSGIIATNKHIIGNAKHIYVLLAGGKILEATVLKNSEADLSLIKINAPLPLKALSLADSSEIQIGKNVFAIANAGFNPQRVQGGQIIKVYRGTSSNIVELLEMNIPLKPGDSGGPVLNAEGSLLGLIMGKQISDPTKSFAIASNRIQQEYFNYRNSILN